MHSRCKQTNEKLCNKLVAAQIQINVVKTRRSTDSDNHQSSTGIAVRLHRNRPHKLAKSFGSLKTVVVQIPAINNQIQKDQSERVVLSDSGKRKNFATKWSHHKFR